MYLERQLKLCLMVYVLPVLVQVNVFLQFKCLHVEHLGCLQRLIEI